MAYKYKFLNNNYVNIEDFAVGLSENYGDAINFIFTNAFLNQIDDYYLRGRIQTEMRRCKYVESVFTMVIYLLNPSLGLCVRGRFFKTLEDLAKYMHVTSTNKDISIIHLFLDNCITHTLGIADNYSEEFKDNIVYIEDNIEDPAIYEYFIDLFDIKFKREDAHGLSVFDYYLSTISTTSSRLDAYLSLINDPGFKSALFKQFGLKQTLEIYGKKNAPFEFIKLIDDYTQLDIVQFLDMGITTWLLKNYNNYKFSHDTSKVKNLLKECARESKQVMSVDERVKFNEKVYIYYRNFLNLYDCQKIVEKSEEYRLDIYYNRNRGCIKYFQDIGLSFDYNQYKINLQTYSKENVKKIMEHSYSEINAYNGIVKEDKHKKSLLPANYKRRLSLSINNSIIILLSSLVLIGLLGYEMYIKSPLFTKVQYLYTSITAILLLVFSITNIIVVKKRRNILLREFLTRDLDYYNESKETNALGYRKAYKSNLFTHVLESTLFGLGLTVISYITLYLLGSGNVLNFHYAFIGMGILGFIFAFISSKRALYDLLLIILAPLAIILLFILF